RFLQRRMKPAAGNFARPHFMNWRFIRIEPRHDNAVQDVPFGDDADDLAVAHDEQAANFMLLHVHGRLVAGGLVTYGQNLRALRSENIVDGRHDSLPYY